jgi:hypothetical protein
MTGEFGSGDQEGKTLKVHLSPIIREALAAVESGEDFDEALLRTLKARYPEEAAVLLPAVGRLIEVEAKRANETKDQVLHRLAEAAPGPEITLNFGGGNISKITAESKTYRVGDRVYHSLEEMPPNLRQAVQKVTSGKSTPIRAGAVPKTGCLFFLLGGWIVALLRIFSR